VSSFRADAISALRRLSEGKPDATVEIYAWVVPMLERQSKGAPLTLLEHIALAYMFRQGNLSRFPDPDTLQQKIQAALADSWRHLKGKPVESRRIAGRLPWSVLRRASREDRLFHSAAFQLDGPKATNSQTAVGQDYVPELNDFVIAIGLLGVAFTAAGGDVLGSFVVGYSIASLAEYSMHRWIGHEAGGPFKPLVEQAGWFGARVSSYLHAGYWGHFVIHHLRTCNKNYTAQFSADPPGDQATIDAELDALGSDGRYIRDTNYGMTLGHEGVIAGIAATLPVYVFLSMILRLDLISEIALVAPTLLYVGASKWLHPYLHKDRGIALEQAGPFMRWLLCTRYAEWISRAHWVHHKGGGGNFNLVPGADVLFGDVRKPTLGMILRMRDQGIIGACWR
jgi:hypothetical protein